MQRGFVVRNVAGLLTLVLAGLSLTGCKSDLFSTGEKPPAIESKPALPPVLTDGTRTSYADIVERVAPTVVTINVKHKVKASSGPQGQSNPDLPDFFRNMPFGQQQPRGPQVEQGLGSGVIVSADGTILTNHHVIDGADEITVNLNDKRSFKAKVVGSDKPSDLAVLKVEAKDLPFMTLGDSDKTRVGDIILAIGDPLGVGQTVTAGIISAKGRRTGLSDGSFEDFLQIDAPINRGNSGGPLINLSGELIGINSQILSPSGGNIGIGFSIPSNMAKSVMDQLLKDGKVHRGQLGVVIQTINENTAKAFGLKESSGVVVSSVKPGSAADKAGVKRGDVIVSMNGEKIEDGNTLRNKIAGTAPGTDVTLSILRDGKEQEVKVKLDEFDTETAAKTKPEQGQVPGKSSQNGKLGLGLQALTPEMAKRLGIPANEKGVVVTEVDPDGPAAEEGIQAGDVILEINRTPISSPDDVQSALDKSGDGYPLLLVSRNGQTTWLTIKPAK